jgi:hypothetical protein
MKSSHLVRMLFVTLITVGLGSCAADGADDAASDACGRAALHLAACQGQKGLGAVSSAPCDTAEADRLLSMSCSDLAFAMGDPKADTWSQDMANFGCRIGLYRYCETPSCEPDQDENFTMPAPATPEVMSACAEAALAWQGCGACDYYRCREETAQCGADGYLMRFAHRYCLRYRLVSEPEGSPEAQAWLKRIRRCLVEVIDRDVPGDDCDTMRQRGFDSHPECYVSTGFCDLSVSDWMLVLNTIDVDDVEFRQMMTTSHLCIKEWFGL